jgi:hypothetical protein
VAVALFLLGAPVIIYGKTKKAVKGNKMIFTFLKRLKKSFQ